MFKYEEYDVGRKFGFLIKKLWILNNLTNGLEVPGKSVLPNGCFNIVVIEGTGLLLKHIGWEKQLTQGIYFCGQMTEAIQVDILPNTKATMVQLYPWTPVHFCTADLSSYTDQVLPFATLPIYSKLNQLPGLDSRAIYIQVVRIFHPLFQTSTNTTLVTNATKIIMDTLGRVSISKMAIELGCSLRHLQKIFKKHIGLSPKQLAVLVSLRSAVDDIAYPQQNKLSLTNLALYNNFYDQAHFTNVFKAVVKTSPNRFNSTDYLLALKK